MSQLAFTLDQEQYEALIALAREGTKDDEGQIDQEEALRLDVFLRKIEADNGITRHAIWVRWQELNQPLPAGTNFPEVWPPTLSVYIEQVTRPISRADIDKVLDDNASNPINVMFTRDPGATHGWTEIYAYT